MTTDFGSVIKTRMKILSALNMMLPDPPKEKLVDALIKVFFWVCVLMVPVFAVMSFNQYVDERTVASSIPTDAVVTGFYRAQTKGHPLFVKIRYINNLTSNEECNVDVLLQANPAGLFVGRTIRIVRISSTCDAPLLVDYLPSALNSLKFSISGIPIGLVFYLIESFRVRKRNPVIKV